MSTLSQADKEILEGQKAIGFDYQFYYFVLLALQLKQGESIGYEFKDDINVDNEDGSTILFQLKHSSQQKKNGEVINLSNLDYDLWHTLFNWIKQINSKKDFLDKHSFVLVSNKSKDNNTFICLIEEFKQNNNLENIKNKIKLLLNKTNSKIILEKIKEIDKLDNINLDKFLKKLDFVNKDYIVTEIKKTLYNLNIPNQFIDIFFNQLFAVLKNISYNQIRKNRIFVLKKEEFINIFNCCFKDIVGKARLPKRDFKKIEPPVNFEKLNFVKQLIDIEAVIINSKKTDPRLLVYWTEMLKTDKYIKYWLKESVITYPDVDNFENECLRNWQNIFHDIYRKVMNQDILTENINFSNKKIIKLSNKVLINVKKINLSISDDYSSPLGIELTNGYFWLLSNRLKIGLHYNWERMYK